MNKELKMRSELVLEVLSKLVAADKSIVFVGGSAIQALLPQPRRLSIDLDVCYGGDYARLLGFLEKEGYSVKQRKSKSTEFAYYSVSKGATLAKLDISRFSIGKTTLHRMPSIPDGVKIATIPYFLAAKLSTLAVGTIGREDAEPQQMLKDIFDISCLLDLGEPLEGMDGEWERIISEESRIRGKHYSEADCAADAQKILLECAAITSNKRILQNTMGSFLDTLTSGSIDRSGICTMACRALCLLSHMGPEFYTIEKEVLVDCTRVDKLLEAARRLEEGNALPAGELRAMKTIAPKALLYLAHWAKKPRGGNPITTTFGVHKPTYG